MSSPIRGDAPSHADPSSEELRQLLARVEAATGPDPELDAAIACAVDGFFIPGEDPWGRPLYCYRDDAGGMVSPGQGHDMLVKPYTGSLDAALALVERLYGQEWTIGYDGVGYRAEMLAHPPYTGRHVIPALALCAALLLAVHALGLRHNARDGAAHKKETT